jgi:UDP-2,3-diacylglucosamine pyrophosphatase LpxH
MSLASKGTKIYITGNHDEMLRNLGDLNLGNIELVDKLIWKWMTKKHGFSW